MCANYKPDTVASCRQYFSAACLALFLFPGLSSAHAQPGVGATVTAAASPALRGNGKIAFTSLRNGLSARSWWPLCLCGGIY